jgi:hypothetical protein
MSYSGFPTGFSLESVIGNIDPYVSSLDPKGAMGVGDFAPMDEGFFNEPYSTVYDPEGGRGPSFIQGLGNFAEEITPLLDGGEKILRALKGMPRRANRFAGEDLGGYVGRQRGMRERAQEAFRPSRPVQSEAENLSQELQIALPERMAEIFRRGLGLGIETKQGPTRLPVIPFRD